MNERARIEEELRRSRERLQRAEREMATLEAQLLLSQKMETVGELAGGVAHDFNNLLLAIQGYTEMMLDAPGDEDHVRRSASEIMDATDRAAALTRQLLTFGRRTGVQPELLHLDRVVSRMRDLLQRLLGETIELRTEAHESPAGVWADASQIQQILLNLAVNARDAMSDGGVLTIETRPVVLEAGDVESTSGLGPGRYVMIRVADTGSGMAPEVRAHVFEPFFTTKRKGKGTGLGLAAVSGIVKQGNGGISVESEPGRGTTFRIYLPQAEVKSGARGRAPVRRPRRGCETILFVEDDPTIRNLAETSLSSRGYRVLKAANGAEALRIAGEQRGAIDLLITDLVMPGMGGRELAERLRQRQGRIPIVFISGYTDDAVSDAESGTVLLPKPFTLSELADTAREVLDLAPCEPEPTPRHRRRSVEDPTRRPD